jgi:hypothetical protein
MYAVELSTRAELLNHIMDASVHIRNYKPSFMRSVILLSRMATMCIGNQGGNLEKLLH